MLRNVLCGAFSIILCAISYVLLFYYFGLLEFIRRLRGKGKIVNLALEHTVKAHKGSRYSSTLSSTLALDVFGRSKPASISLPPGNRPGKSLYTKLCGPQFPSGRVRKSRLTSIRSSDLPVRNQFLYRLSYPGTLPYTRNEGNVHSPGTVVPLLYLHQGTQSTELRSNGMHDGQI